MNTHTEEEAAFWRMLDEASVNCALRPELHMKNDRQIHESLGRVARTERGQAVLIGKRDELMQKVRLLEMYIDEQPPTHGRCGLVKGE